MSVCIHAAVLPVGLGLCLEPCHSAGCGRLADRLCHWRLYCTMGPISADSLDVLGHCRECVFMPKFTLCGPPAQSVNTEHYCAEKIKIFILSEMTPHIWSRVYRSNSVSDTNYLLKFWSLRWNFVISNTAWNKLNLIGILKSSCSLEILVTTISGRRPI